MFDCRNQHKLQARVYVQYKTMQLSAGRCSSLIIIFKGGEVVMILGLIHPGLPLCTLRNSLCCEIEKHQPVS